MDKNKNISIGENEFINWIDFDARSVNPTKIDHLLETTTKFWKLLEIECVAECCGIDAFSFWAEDIANANRKANISNLGNLIGKAIDEISKLESEVIVSSQLNQLINRQVFLKLLKHVKKNLKST